MADLPIINIAAWRDGTAHERQRAAAEADDALRTFGFLLISEHGVPDELAALVRADARTFFELSEDRKDPYRIRVGGRGWIPPGAESNSYASGIAAPPDLKETYKVGLGRPDDPEVVQPDVFPSELPRFEAIVRSYLEHVWRLAVDLFTLFEQALGLSAGTLTQHASAAASSLNINYYPSQRMTGPPKEGQFRIGAHTDFGVLTILDRQVGYGGLQIQGPEGEWMNAPDVPGTLTINVGDMLSRWTGARWRSTIHRVMPPSTQNPDEVLLSLVNFCGVRPSTIIRTLPVGGATTFEPIVAGEYMRSKLASIDVIAKQPSSTW